MKIYRILTFISCLPEEINTYCVLLSMGDQYKFRERYLKYNRGNLWSEHWKRPKCHHDALAYFCVSHLQGLPRRAGRSWKVKRKTNRISLLQNTVQCIIVTGLIFGLSTKNVRSTFGVSLLIFVFLISKGFPGRAGGRTGKKRKKEND